MKIKLLLSLLTIAATSAFARIGDVPEQCMWRYGFPLTEETLTRVLGYGNLKYKTDAFQIGVHFYESKVNYVKYKGVGLTELTEANIMRLLELNSNTMSWARKEPGFWAGLFTSKDTVTWTTPTGSLIAVYSHNQLEIYTKEYSDRKYADKAALETACSKAIAADKVKAEEKLNNWHFGVWF